MRDVTLAMKLMTESHTGDYVTDLLEHVLANYEQDTEPLLSERATTPANRSTQRDHTLHRLRRYFRRTGPAGVVESQRAGLPAAG